jgi:hypothetical protein
LSFRTTASAMILLTFFWVIMTCTFVLSGNPYKRLRGKKSKNGWCQLLRCYRYGFCNRTRNHKGPPFSFAVEVVPGTYRIGKRDSPLAIGTWHPGREPPPYRVYTTNYSTIHRRCLGSTIEQYCNVNCTVVPLDSIHITVS